jgi:hypothetical protein
MAIALIRLQFKKKLDVLFAFGDYEEIISEDGITSRTSTTASCLTVGPANDKAIPGLERGDQNSSVETSL